VAYLKNLQPIELLHRHHHDDGASMLGARHRLGAGKVDQPAEAVLGVLRRQGLNVIPRNASG
jgi:hypothetical protein